ncbi:hypothetical protein WN48_07876 [Eufriesea mexicana]|nr:hypothetical protein WN48_07876 [Eufriesea mexicana]
MRFAEEPTVKPHTERRQLLPTRSRHDIAEPAIRRKSPRPPHEIWHPPELMKPATHRKPQMSSNGKARPLELASHTDLTTVLWSRNTLTTLGSESTLAQPSGRITARALTLYLRTFRTPKSKSIRCLYGMLCHWTPASDATRAISVQFQYHFIVVLAQLQYIMRNLLVQPQISIRSA